MLLNLPAVALVLNWRSRWLPDVQGVLTLLPVRTKLRYILRKTFKSSLTMFERASIKAESRIVTESNAISSLHSEIIAYNLMLD
jgi:hypothetical protein